MKNIGNMLRNGALWLSIVLLVSLFLPLICMLPPLPLACGGSRVDTSVTAGCRPLPVRTAAALQR